MEKANTFGQKLGTGTKESINPTSEMDTANTSSIRNIFRKDNGTGALWSQSLQKNRFRSPMRGASEIMVFIIYLAN